MRVHAEEDRQRNVVTGRERLRVPARRHEDLDFSPPGERALDAMAHAVARARELTRGSDTHSDAPNSGETDAGDQSVFCRPGPQVARPQQPPRALVPSTSTFRRRHVSAKTLLQVSVAVVGVLVLGFGGALAALHVRGPARATPVGAGTIQRPHHPSLTPRTNRYARTRGGAAASSIPPPTVAPRNSESATAKYALAGPRPQLVSVSPTAGRAGQLVTISGDNLYSPDGLIQASLGGADAPVRCTTQTTCVVTVPMGLVPSQDEPLVIETQVGTSNALIFFYE
jgi:hypothetical protein